jgi:hypothetical protein
LTNVNDTLQQSTVARRWHDARARFILQIWRGRRMQHEEKQSHTGGVVKVGSEFLDTELLFIGIFFRRAEIPSDQRLFAHKPKMNKRMAMTDEKHEERQHQLAQRLLALAHEAAKIMPVGRVLTAILSAGISFAMQHNSTDEVADLLRQAADRIAKGQPPRSVNERRHQPLPISQGKRRFTREWRRLERNRESSRGEPYSLAPWARPPSN